MFNHHQYLVPYGYRSLHDFPETTYCPTEYGQLTILNSTSFICLMGAIQAPKGSSSM